MKKGLFLAAMALVLAVSGAFAQTKEVNWVTNYDQAVKDAKASGKTLLLNFTGSDWCGWCIRLHNEVFSKPEFVDYASKNLICVKLDFPRRTAQDPALTQQNERLAQQMGITGFPTIILADGTGKPFARTGYQAGGPVNYVNHLKGFITKK
jgi:protein disulfide-isomerase